MAASTTTPKPSNCLDHNTIPFNALLRPPTRSLLTTLDFTSPYIIAFTIFAMIRYFSTLLYGIIFLESASFVLPADWIDQTFPVNRWVLAAIE